MTAWWMDLSPRERLMLMAGGAVLGFAALFFVVVRPLQGFSSDARADYDRAVSTFRQVAVAAQSPADGQVNAAQLRSVITSTASASGIVINRISSQGDAIDISTQGTTPARLYGWLAVLEEQHGVTVRDAQLRPSSEAGITARLTLAAGGGA